jgi:hypothetical protein
LDFLDFIYLLLFLPKSQTQSASRAEKQIGFSIHIEVIESWIDRLGQAVGGVAK